MNRLTDEVALVSGSARAEEPAAEGASVVITGCNASESGLRGLSKRAALDLGRHDVRVDTVHPG